MTTYIIGSLDQPVYFEAMAYPLRADNKFRGIFTPAEANALRFDSYRGAALVLFNLEADDPAAQALNLIIIPIRPAQLVLL